MLVTPFHEGPNGGWRGVKNAHLVALHNLPKAAAMGRVRSSLINDLCGSISEGSIDDVGMPGHPADVSRAPVDVTIWFEIENRPVGECSLSEVATGCVKNSFWFSGSPGGIENK